ncbi:carbohydrate ABC transporter permease [Paenibacillus sp. ACRRX]|uniref:carbohydrate ABC transporter permease n=1 Tax=unclassified Paenibacillus TaxID=185978 RepID=UPI001EF5E10A|nr:MULTISPECIES: carbohydrate ABC transporter permease [unclassified Paenibacillus]MCG7408913.1 carbohydrate ABC transporter permease [Paenibacillus sp. ACRRX]MDK8182176.1 carbohydrate ABC transporter permease [Paenibacillus sp. UMB4589-SE434]
MYHKTTGYRVFSACNYIFLITLSVLCILPLIHLMAVSFSGPAPANAGLITFWPKDFTIEAYQKTFDNPNFLNSMWISVQRTVLGTILSMTVTTCAAYALSKEKVLGGRNAYMWYFIFTMLFSGGIIPGYILITKLGLINTLWALILPGLVGVYNIILMLNFFRNIPRELEEAAVIDGANHFQTFLRVYLPISMPSIATITLFIIVGHWNSYFDGLIYMREVEKLPLATLLQTIVVQTDFTNMDPETVKKLSQRTVKSAQIFISLIPILAIYPFLQKYFVHGIVLGAVKE